MSNGSTPRGRSSAAGRLAARAARPAVHAREDFPHLHVVELDRVAAAEAVPTTGAAPPVQRTTTQWVPSSEPPSLPSPAGRVEIAARPLEPERDAPGGALVPQTASPEERHRPALLPVASAQRDSEDGPFPDVVPTWTLIDDPVPLGRASHVSELEAQQDAPGWQSLGKPQQSDPRPETRVAPQDAVAAAARGRALTADPPRELVAPPPPPTPAAPPASVAALPHSQAEPVSGPPQVLIDRIEVITPAARLPAPDPFLSLAARRVGASRHGGSA